MRECAWVVAAALWCGCRAAPAQPAPVAATPEPKPKQVASPIERTPDAPPVEPKTSAPAEPDPVVTVDVLASGKGRVGPVRIEGDGVVLMAGDCVRRWRPGVKELRNVACAPRGVDPLNEMTMSVDATAIYVVYDRSYGRACGVYRIDAKGQRRLAMANPCPDSLAHDDEHLYAAGLESVWRVPVRGGQREVVARFGGGASSLVARDTVLMWASLADDAIMLVPKRGGDMRALASMKVEVLAIDERWLYAVDNRGDELWRLDPLEGTQESLGSISGCTRSLAVDDTFVYGATRCARQNADDDALDTIWRMRKEGGRMQSLADVPSPASLAATDGTIYTTTLDANDCSRLERYAKQVDTAVLGICDPGRWSLRRITSK